MADCITPGEEEWSAEQQEVQWCQEALDKLIDSDALWGFTVRANNKLQHLDCHVLDDPVLFQTLSIGVYNGEHKSVSSALRVAAVATIGLLSKITNPLFKIHDCNSWVLTLANNCDRLMGWREIFSNCARSFSRPGRWLFPLLTTTSPSLEKMSELSMRGLVVIVLNWTLRSLTTKD